MTVKRSKANKTYAHLFCFASVGAEDNYWLQLYVWTTTAELNLYEYTHDDALSVFYWCDLHFMTWSLIGSMFLIFLQSEFDSQ